MKKFTLLLAIAMFSLVSYATDYKKVTSAPTDWSGEYILVYESSATQALVWNCNDAISGYTIETVSKDVITITDPANTFTIAPKDEGWSILLNAGDNKGTYLQGKSKNNAADNGCAFSETAVTNTLSYNVNGYVVITSPQGSIMSYNSTSGQTRFRYFKPATVGTFSGAYKPVQLYKKVEACQGYAINIDNQITYGTISADVETACEGETVTLTATPAEGYVLEGWRIVDENNNEITVTDNTFTMPAAAVNVTASFRKAKEYTITWMTMQGESTTTAIEGQAIAAPADPTYAGKVFMGWSQNNSVAADGADFTAVNFTATTATANATYYAVFATKSVGGEPVYKKITSNDELTDGKYLLVATVSNVKSYAAGTKNSTNSYSSAAEVIVTDDVVSDKAEAVEFSIVMVDGTTNFAMNDGENWLTSTANKADITYTGVEQAAPTDAYWKLTADGYVQSTNTTSNRYFGYNTQAPRFAAYANTSGQQIGAQLYKYSQSITTSDYVVAAYIEVEPAAIDFGELKDNENMSEKAEMVIALGHNLSEGITATLSEDAQFTIVSEPDGEGSLMVTVTPKPVIGTNEATLTFTSGICTATVALKAVIVKGTATGIEDAATSAVFSKMIENGQLVIVREGVKYNAMGVRLQ